MSDLPFATEYRSFPAPQRPWAMTMTWHRLLFAHWPLPPAQVRELVPPALELDTFEGEAWVGLVPFDMSNVKLRGLVGFPFSTRFPECNVRTYVRVGDIGGVFFFSLDAANAPAVWGARSFFGLPYFLASMHTARRDGWVRYRTRRIHPDAPPAELRARYRPTAPVLDDPGELANWLTDRLCLYTVNPAGEPRRTDIHHLPWPLQPAEWEPEVDTMLPPGLTPGGRAPLLHYAERLDVIAWTPAPV